MSIQLFIYLFIYFEILILTNKKILKIQYFPSQFFSFDFFLENFNIFVNIVISVIAAKVVGQPVNNWFVKRVLSTIIL